MTVPLCVDLDGTLLTTDSCWEAFFLLMKKNPLFVFYCGVWILRGLAYLKFKIGERVDINPATFSYSEDLLRFLHTECADGRELILVTAATRKVAEKIAAHLGIFSDVIASDSATNVKGEMKRRILDGRFGHGCYDYAGNSPVDVAVWRGARQAIVVNASAKTLRLAKKIGNVQRVFMNGIKS